MGYLENFEEDVFISYAHFDDDQYGDEPRGWVAQLHADLEKCVPVHLGAKASLWRDCEIRDYEDFEKKILRRLPKTATFLFINSPSFFNREWCTRELEAFYSYAKQNIGIHIDEEKVRIFKIEKNRVDGERLPPALKMSGSYRFYAPDPANSKREHPLRPKMGPEEFRSYYMKIDDLSKDLADVLQAMASLSNGNQPEPASMAVYLAEVTSDLREEANEIRRDLKCRGYTVLPPFELTDQVREFKEQVRSYLKRSVLSIHMIGNEFGVIPEGEVTKSKPWIQHDLAMEREQNAGFERLIWLPKGAPPEDTRQQKFADYLLNDKDVQKNGAEILACNLEGLKELLTNRLEKGKNGSARATAIGPGARPIGDSPVPDDLVRVYIICDPADLSSPALQAIKKQFLAAGYEPLLPSEIDDEKEAINEHFEYMDMCDAALIYYGQGTRGWFNAKLMDFRKLLNKRARPVRAKAIYIAPPATPAKEALETLEARILRGSDRESLPQLDEFLKLLKR